VLASEIGGGCWLVAVKCETGDRETMLTIRDVLEHYEIDYDRIEVAPPNVGTYEGAPCIIEYDNLF